MCVCGVCVWCVYVCACVCVCVSECVCVGERGSGDRLEEGLYARVFSQLDVSVTAT